MHTGYVARPDCLSTFGLLGAVSSLSIVHFASPVPVLVAVQPGGGVPIVRSSKLRVCANAALAEVNVKSAITGSSFIAFSSLYYRSQEFDGKPQDSHSL